jgi:hypothetical protein
VKFLLKATLVLLLAQNSLAADAPQAEKGFVSLFDGKTLDGWKVGENANLFSVHNGMIVMDCPATINRPAHLFYVGNICQHDFKNFDLKVDVMTFPGANSGIYFHTRYQEADWPNFGLECQVNNSHVDWRRTGSLWGVKNITWNTGIPMQKTKEDVAILAEAPVKDNHWYTQEILYQNGLVTIKLDGKTMIEYQVPKAEIEHELPTNRTWLPRGTFALQGHPPMPGHISKVYFKNIRLKVLPDK